MNKPETRRASPNSAFRASSAHTPTLYVRACRGEELPEVAPADECATFLVGDKFFKGADPKLEREALDCLLSPRYRSKQVIIGTRPRFPDLEVVNDAVSELAKYSLGTYLTATQTVTLIEKISRSHNETLRFSTEREDIIGFRLVDLASWRDDLRSVGVWGPLAEEKLAHLAVSDVAIEPGDHAATEQDEEVTTPQLKALLVPEGFRLKHGKDYPQIANVIALLSFREAALLKTEGRGKVLRWSLLPAKKFLAGKGYEVVPIKAVEVPAERHYLGKIFSTTVKSRSSG